MNDKITVKEHIKEKEILDELAEAFEGKGIDYESLKNAIESRKFAREIEGMGLNKSLAIFSALLAFITAIASVTFLGFQLMESNRAGEKAERQNATLVNERYEAFLGREVTDLKDKRDGMSVDVERLNLQKSSLVNEIETLKKNKRQLEDDANKLGENQSAQKRELNTLTLEINALESKRNSLAIEALNNVRRSEIQAKLDQASREIETLTSQLSVSSTELTGIKTQLQQQENQLTQTIQSYASLGPFESELTSGLIPRDGNLTVGSYTAELVNVGNIKENMDLRLTGDAGSTLLTNLNQGYSYVIRFDRKIFLVDIIEVVQSPNDRAKEKAEFRVSVLDYNGYFVK